MDEQNNLQEQAASSVNSIKFHFTKSVLYRVIHADGAWGGITPRRLIHMAFFNERNPIPRNVTHTIVDGQLGDEVLDKRETRDGIVREVEVGVVMNLETAKAVVRWLNERIAQLEAIRAQAEEGETDEPSC